MKKQINAPKAEKKNHITNIHGLKMEDDFYWLREKENSQVIDYIKAENDYTDAKTAHLEKRVQELYDEILGRIQQTDLTVPVLNGGYFYYSRTLEGKNYSIYCRRKAKSANGGNAGSESAVDTDIENAGPEEILLDLNKLAEGQEFMRLGAFELSPDHKLLAYSTDNDGSETFTLYVKNLESGKLYPDSISGTYPFVEWANDNKTLFYTMPDKAKRPALIYRHRLGQKGEDELVYNEENRLYLARISKTRDKKWLTIAISSKNTTEYWIMPGDQPDGQFRLFQKRIADMRYYIDSHQQDFYIMTDFEAPNNRMMKTNSAKTGRENWVEIIPHSPQIKLESFQNFKDHLVLYERVDGITQIKVLNHKMKGHYIKFKEKLYTVAGAENPDYYSKTLRFSFSSLITPKTVYDYDIKAKSLKKLKQIQVLGDFDPANYITKREWATAPDGTEIPLSIVHKKGLKKCGNKPLYLYGYGSYGICVDPEFSSLRLSLLNRGFVFVIAHIRGGGEMGRAWHDNGKMLNKKNTFTDFIAAAERVIELGYTNKEKIVIEGRSAGGLLMGATVNMRPDLFKLVIAGVPFVDVINTMLDETIPLTVGEFEEWGNPKEKKYFDYMISYSPYDNVQATDYPNMILLAGLNDPRVQYWEPAKFTAKLRTMKKDNNLLLLKTNMGAGHGGPSARYEAIKEQAFLYALVFDILKIKK